MTTNCAGQWVRIDPLDISVTPLTAPEVAEIVANASGKRLLLNHNLHSAYLHDVDSRFRELYRRATWVIVDGAPILWLTSQFSTDTFGTSWRVSSTDWLEALTRVHSSGRLFIFGATADSNQKAVDVLRGRLTNWAISGVDGYVNDEVAVKAITDFNPDLVIVGLGMPRQEHFLLRNFDGLPAATYATVGGAIDYVGGSTRLAPRWLGSLGLEWLWRLLNEPRRLAHRYLIEPVLLLRRVVPRVLRQT
ncbi:WecB/TagA/CpsF family glycosyltransferase [Mycolicibacterium baixiangningiae]|uniref:WecB/TagA/CpsF family glycosyltransferase n=1 Tax=Mycolicibacterium baixiangningiae TaxID=2761578 RepID=UPI0018693EA2|nr:WecB/TagA/CpsF family glycosyltransferase [Mycolicibacterium baixiangningiae]